MQVSGGGGVIKVWYEAKVFIIESFALASETVMGKQMKWL